MYSVISMAQGLLELGRARLTQRRPYDGIAVLRRLLSTTDLAPDIAAEASRLLAEGHVQLADFDRARQTLRAALSGDPRNAELHFMLGKLMADENADDDRAEAVVHFEHAAELDPADARKTSALGLQLVRARRAARGLKLLERTYAGHHGEPQIVADYADALLENARPDEAELLVLQAAARHADDGRFARLRQRFQQRIRQRRLFGASDRSAEGRCRAGGSAILPFRNFEPPKKAGGNRRPAARPERPRPSAPVPGPVPLDEKMGLTDVLRRVGPGTTARIYDELGLVGKTRPDARRREIAAALSQPAFLADLLRDLPSDSRKLIRTVVRSGGYVPASVLFQNTGPEAPPPDYVQPLLQRGLLFFGTDPRRASATHLMAVIPADLLHRLAKALRVRLDDSSA